MYLPALSMPGYNLLNSTLSVSSITLRPVSYRELSTVKEILMPTLSKHSDIDWDVVGDEAVTNLRNLLILLPYLTNRIISD
jgi:hypothetical protein